MFGKMPIRGGGDPNIPKQLFAIFCVWITSKKLIANYKTNK